MDLAKLEMDSDILPVLSSSVNSYLNQAQCRSGQAYGF